MKKNDKLKKVVSIFICFDAPTKEENSLAIFRLLKDMKIGYNETRKENGNGRKRNRTRSTID